MLKKRKISSRILSALYAFYRNCVSIIKYTISALLDYFFPYICQVCKTLIESDSIFCSSCFNKLTFISRPYCKKCGRPFELEISAEKLCIKCTKSLPSYDAGYAILKFNEVSKKIIHAFKYYDQTTIGVKFANLIYMRYKNELDSCDFIVPVPMFKWKRVLRKYNQADILARELGRISNKYVGYDILKKVKWTKSQTFLNKNKRMLNLQDSIKISNNTDMIKNKAIALIDDVQTTGITSSMCASELKKYGAKSVLLFCIAST